jgi:hypothetical protein
MDLHSVQPNTIVIVDEKETKLLVWEACRGWLRLLVVHFEALAILTKDTSFEKPTLVTIKVIATPLLEHSLKMLTWWTLLKKYYNDTEPPLADVITAIEALQTDNEKVADAIAGMQALKTDSKKEALLQDALHLPKPIPASFFKNNFGENSSLSCGCGFTGVDHCKASLAIFMSKKLGSIPSQFQDGYNSILEELSVSHIFSLQCPHPSDLYSGL